MMFARVLLVAIAALLLAGPPPTVIRGGGAHADSITDTTTPIDMPDLPMPTPGVITEAQLDDLG